MLGLEPFPGSTGSLGPNRLVRGAWEQLLWCSVAPWIPTGPTVAT